MNNSFEEANASDEESEKTELKNKIANDNELRDFSKMTR